MSKKPEQIIDINDRWKSKGSEFRNDSSSFERIFKAGSPGRQKTDGDVPQVILERTLKLREYDTRGKNFNIINGINDNQDKWILAFPPHN